jgi:hypothetical protein
MASIARLAGAAHHRIHGKGHSMEMIELGLLLPDSVTNANTACRQKQFAVFALPAPSF